jgi:NAD-dependent deacetylase
MAEWFDPQTSIAIDLIRYSKNIVAFTGAGISTASGIPDFRSPGGLWECFNPLKYANYDIFLEKPEYYWEMERALIDMFYKAKPNKSHKLLVKLEKKGKLKAIITQNIDNLHQKAGSKVPLIELHGNAKKAHCMDCGKTIKRNYITKRLRIGDTVPRCPYCEGRIKTGVLLFNEPMAEKKLVEATEYAEQCDLMLILGSSLTVFPANQIPLLAKKAGAKLVFINRDPTYMDRHASVRLLGDLGVYLPLIISYIGGKSNG